ncbi:MAG: Gfo/Idh/MocA family oxidoreductase [Planctomycetes bacterium]|nr:Gfo/Idh/MocA family oxidoreductase [Planctomycetota bacterium]
MAERLRVGVIGRTGKGSYGHGIDTVWGEVPETEVVAVADEQEAGRRDAQKRTKAANAYADYREMLDKERLQIVAIGPRWIDQHRDLAIAAAEHGCHIYMEKPFVPTPGQADDVIRACEMRHIKLALAHQTHYAPTAILAKKLIADGQIGDMLELRGRGKEDQRGGGEDLWVLGSHVLDLMRFFAGDVLDCYATVTTKGHPISAADIAEGNEGLGLLAGDAVHARYTFAKGILGSFSSVRGQGGNPSRFGLQIFGSRGVIEIGTGYPAPVWILKDPAWSPGRSGATWQMVSSNGIGKPETIKGGGLHAGNVAAVLDLLDAIKNDRQPACSMYDGRAVVEMISAVFASQRAGQPVALPLAERGNPLAAIKSP